MSVRYKRCALLGVLIAILLIVILSRIQPSTTADAIGMTFVGYTNLPGNVTRFALFSVSNRSSYAVRWRGDWVEVAGSRERRARTVNPSLPGYTYEPVLNGGGSLGLAVGEPSDNEDWRFIMSWSRYSWQERWLDFSFRHRLPLKLGPVALIDSERILSPSNRVTVSTAWLGK